MLTTSHNAIFHWEFWNNALWDTHQYALWDDLKFYIHHLLADCRRFTFTSSYTAAWSRFSHTTPTAFGTIFSETAVTFLAIFYYCITTEWEATRYKQSFYSQGYSFMLISRAPTPKKTKKAPHHRHQTQSTENPSSKTQSKTPTLKPLQMSKNEKKRITLGKNRAQTTTTTTTKPHCHISGGVFIRRT